MLFVNVATRQNQNRTTVRQTSIHRINISVKWIKQPAYGPHRHSRCSKLQSTLWLNFKDVWAPGQTKIYLNADFFLMDQQLDGFTIRSH